MVTQRVQMNWQAVATAMIRDQGIHAGWWRVYLGFEVVGVNLGYKGTLTPGVMAPVTQVGLMREADDSHSVLAVNAAEVNPPSRLVLPPSARTVQ